MSNEVTINVEEGDLRSIAHRIFSTPPNPYNSFKLCTEEDDTEYRFEVLLTFFIEGALVRFGEFGEIDMESLKEGTIYKELNDLGAWFSIMDVDLYITNIDSFDRDARIREQSGQYCKVLLKDGPDRIFFKMKNISEPYYFLGNGLDIRRDNIRDYWALLNIGRFTFRVSFDFV